MNYQIIIAKSVQKQLDILLETIKKRIGQKLLLLTNDPRPPGTVKLKNSSQEYRLRVGNYRIRYEINDSENIVRILQCKHRREVYRP
ncbi:MAG: type II toxin-antitoxin system RelE/ParE family toxin [Synechocystis sp.]|nr:type II toxin-antitoxin system RelE/ParE family toxin [Synechocystis sp.]